MSFEYLIDSYAWIEYYLGEDVRLKLLIETKEIATSTIVIAELSDKFARENENFKDFFQFISSRSKLVPLSVEIALASGKFKSQMRKKYKQFGLADAIIYLTAKLNNSKLLTGDHHFEGLDGVDFVKCQNFPSSL